MYFMYIYVITFAIQGFKVTSDTLDNSVCQHVKDKFISLNIGEADTVSGSKINGVCLIKVIFSVHMQYLFIYL